MQSLTPVLQIAITSLHATAQWAIPQLIKLAKTETAAKPSFLITSSALPLKPIPDMFVLSLMKAAQQNMAKSMAMVYGPEKVHVGLIMVGGGPVTPESATLNPKNIAEKTWDFFNLEWEKNTFEVEIW